jgi:4'-phosphopantetheinyl transferase
VWALQLDSEARWLPPFESVLTSGELQRADRFRFEHLRTSYVLAHGALRFLLGGYLRIDPANVTFRSGQRGKPYLADYGAVQFNLSHSCNVALIAVARNSELGVDVERIRSVGGLYSIASRFFSPAETAALLGLPEEQRHQAFFLCWTRKEAYVKAIGEGLHAPLDRVRVALEPGAPARFLRVLKSYGVLSEWQLHDLAISPDCASALAYRDPVRKTVLLRSVTATAVLELW